MTLSGCIIQLKHQYRLPKYCLGEGEGSMEMTNVEKKVFEQYLNVYKIEHFSPKLFQDEL